MLVFLIKREAPVPEVHKGEVGRPSAQAALFLRPEHEVKGVGQRTPPVGRSPTSVVVIGRRVDANAV